MLWLYNLYWFKIFWSESIQLLFHRLSIKWKQKPPKHWPEKKCVSQWKILCPFSKGLNCIFVFSLHIFSCRFDIFLLLNYSCCSKLINIDVNCEMCKTQRACLKLLPLPHFPDDSKRCVQRSALWSKSQLYVYRSR